jgi:hypothetical protein
MPVLNLNYRLALRAEPAAFAMISPALLPKTSASMAAGWVLFMSAKTTSAAGAVWQGPLFSAVRLRPRLRSEMFRDRGRSSGPMNIEAPPEFS